MARTINSLKSFLLTGIVVGTASKKYFLKARNLTSKEEITIIPAVGDKTTEYQFIVNVADFSNSSGTKSGWSIGDIIEIIVYGQGYGYTTHTITSSTGGIKLANITITDHASTNCPGVSI